MWRILAFSGAAVALLAAMNWQGIMLGIAVAVSDRRPALLADAQWNAPLSDRLFEARFAPGTPEAELLHWLRANGFAPDRGTGRAERLIASLPCNERVSVEWTASAGRLERARATVAEAGCL